MIKNLNPYLVVPLLGWLAAQITKLGLDLIKNGRLDWRLLYAAGGMPSAHSATMAAVATTAGILEGLGSPLFGISTVFTAVVLYDSFGVRRAAGDQGTVINTIVAQLKTTGAKKVRELIGHRPSEVIVGALTGVVVAFFTTKFFY